MALLLAILHDNAPAVAGSPSGAEIIKAMVGETGSALPTMDHALRLQLTAAVQDAFQSIFMVGALIALASVALALRMPDEVLSEQPVA